MSTRARRLAVVGGAILIFVLCGAGVILPLLKGQPLLPPAGSCTEQFEQWFDQTSPWIVRLSKAHAQNDAAGERTAALMLGAVPPPPCRTDGHKWHKTMGRIADQKPLGPLQKRSLQRNTSISW